MYWVMIHLHWLEQASFAKWECRHGQPHMLWTGNMHLLTLLIAQDTKIKLILRRPIFMWVMFTLPLDSLSTWSAVQWTGIILYEQQARQGVFINFTSLIFSGCVGCNVKVQKLTGNIIQNTKSWKVFKLCTFQDIYWCFCERSS